MIKKEEVLRYLGYGGQDFSAELESVLDKYIELAEKSLKPKFIYRIFDIEISDKVYLGNTNIAFVGEDIKKHLKGASKCAVMAATLGLESERLLAYLSKTKLSEAVIFDAVCTAKIEDVSDICEEEIKLWTKENSYHTNFRYSPGYGDFPLEYQRQITNLLGCDKALGLTTTESSLLIPQKSVTAVIGIFLDETRKTKNSCESCNLKETCQFRKTGNSCERSEK